MQEVFDECWKRTRVVADEESVSVGQGCGSSWERFGFPRMARQVQFFNLGKRRGCLSTLRGTGHDFACATSGNERRDKEEGGLAFASEKK